MSDYWAIPEKEYDLSLLQFAREKLARMGYSVISEKVEVCSGAGALTMTAIIKNKEEQFGLYLHDGPKQRKSRGPPIISIFRLLPGMENADDLRNFVLTHQHDFHAILSSENSTLNDRIKVDIRRIYLSLYNSKIKDLYDTDLSTAADILRMRLRKENIESRG